jgi:hypothetical protein
LMRLARGEFSRSSVQSTPRYGGPEAAPTLN